MPIFIRAWAPGGTFFFTVVTYHRRRLFDRKMARGVLREAFIWVRERHPFRMNAAVLLPDHLHCLWTLPEGDSDFSGRWRGIKNTFTARYLAKGGREWPVSAGEARKGQRGIWQPRFWEHTIRDEVDYQRHVDYIHYNPVKHGCSRCAHGWQWSSFSRWVEAGYYENDWCCDCGKTRHRPLVFEDIEESAME